MRTVALMDRDGVNAFALAEVDSDFPSIPDILVNDGKFYVPGPTGGGGGPNTLVPGHPEVGEGYTLATIDTPIKVVLI